MRFEQHLGTRLRVPRFALHTKRFKVNVRQENELMEAFLIVVFFTVFIAAVALPLSFLVRMGFLPFSQRVRNQVKTHPVLHILWFLFAAVLFTMVFVVTGSD